jgi:amino acid transporter
VKRSHWGFILSTAAVIWSVALLGVAYVAPVYATTSTDMTCNSAGHCTGRLSKGGLTLVDVNGTGVLYLLGVLIALTVACWLGLHFRCSRGSVLGLFVGWLAAGLMALLGMVSFGLFALILPMALMMILAAVKTPSPPRGES